ncbi:polysaccharide biosynthesis/export family protein [Alcaligenaceae bacterium]|nr:polysaccharide biosynthesis/export family protein [Alcaligenaceae bacterium]
MTASIPQESRLPLRLARLGAITLSAAVLSACALAPGMNMGGPQAAAQAVEDVAPEGALTPITPELISQQRAALTTEVKSDVKRLYGKSKIYTIGAGDILNIVVWDHPELAMSTISSSRSTGSLSQADIGNGYPVSANGTIQFPFVGSIKVAGLTDEQVRDLLTKRIATYINNPQLTVRIQTYRSNRIYVDGEVRAPGLQVIDDLPMTLPEALNRAGGFTPDADRSSVVLIRNGTSIDINLPQLTRLGINPNKIMLTNGDMLRVLNREESKVFVLGEVFKPHSQPLRDGHLSLTEALGEAGGVDQLTGNPRQIYVVRKGADDNAQIFHLDAASPAAFVLANEFELHARDVVFVDAAAIVRWNRVISNLLPSYGSIVTTRNLTR